MTAPHEEEHSRRCQQVGDEYLVPSHPAEGRAGEQRRQSESAELERDERDEEAGEYCGSSSRLVHYAHDDYSDDSKRSVVKNRVADDADEHRIGHHGGLAEHAEEPGAEDVGCVEGMSCEDVYDREPDHDGGGTYETGIDSFTDRIVPLSHRSASHVRY